MANTFCLFEKDFFKVWGGVKFMLIFFPIKLKNIENQNILNVQNEGSNPKISNKNYLTFFRVNIFCYTCRYLPELIFKKTFVQLFIKIIPINYFASRVPS